MIPALLRRWTAQARPLCTERLQLVAITPAMLNAESMGRAALEQELGVRVPPEWPPQLWETHVWLHIAAQFEAAPATLGWHRYIIAGGSEARLVGCIGGFPGPHGDVEIGYSVTDGEQRRGYGTEAAGALTAWLLERPEVRSVSAQAYATAPWSIKVMQRCGMQPVGAGDEPETVRYRRWRRGAER